MMQQSRNVVAVIILVLLMISPRILMSGQVLPLDHLLYQLDVVFIDFGAPVHQHHHVVVGGGVVPRRLRHVRWKSARGGRGIRAVHMEHSGHVGDVAVVAQVRRDMNVVKKVSRVIRLAFIHDLIV